MGLCRLPRGRDHEGREQFLWTVKDRFGCRRGWRGRGLPSLSSLHIRRGFFPVLTLTLTPKTAQFRGRTSLSTEARSAQQGALLGALSSPPPLTIAHEMLSEQAARQGKRLPPSETSPSGRSEDGAAPESGGPDEPRVCRASPRSSTCGVEGCSKTVPEAPSGPVPPVSTLPGASMSRRMAFPP